MTDPIVPAIRQAIAEAPQAQVVLVKCTQASPLKVSIRGQGSIPAKALAGSTFAVNDVGYALWQPPLPPHCYKVT